MSVLAPIADVETSLLDWLKESFTELADRPGGPVDEHVGNDFPGPSLDARLPFVVVQRVAGSTTMLRDYPVVDVDFLGSRRQETYDLAQRVHMGLLAAPVYAGGVVIDTVDARVSPRRLPWDNPGIRRWGATYELSVRRR